MSDYRKLENQPLKLVLAEFRFSQVMKIEEYIPEIQEALRKSYPTIKKRNMQAVQFQAESIQISNIDTWSFVAANKKSSIDINQERLVFITTEYQRFEGFADLCKEALDVLAKVVQPSLILRIGLRYCDLVKLEQEEKIDDLVDSQFVGSPVSVSSVGKTKHQRTESLFDTNIGTLSIRTLYGHNTLTYPPDIQGLPIVVVKDQSESERMILDFDHFWEPKEESPSFETNDILSNLKLLHDASREAFWKITTDYARNEKWS